MMGDRQGNRNRDKDRDDKPQMPLEPVVGDVSTM